MSRSLAIILLLVFLCALAFGVFTGIPALASRQYGPPAPTLGLWDRFNYSTRLLWYDGMLTSPLNPNGTEQTFAVESGESVGSIALRLEDEGLITDAAAFRDYLVYTGLDTSIQARDFILSPAMSMVDIARELQDATPDQLTFVVLPGWRMEEIAASLATSGLDISYETFVAAASSAPRGFDFIPAEASSEGFLYPDTYILPREVTADQLVTEFVRNSALHLTTDMREGFSRQGLTIYEAVTLASIVQREAVVPDEHLYS